jgi:hypothetical protein
MDKDLWKSDKRKAIITALDAGEREDDPNFIEKLIF